MSFQNTFKYLAILLPGLLPLIVFVVVDEFLGAKWAILTALASGVAIFSYTWFRNRKPDTFVLFDTLLLAAFGGVSLLLDDDIFFKLKPGVIQSILVVIIGVSAYSPKNLILGMVQRYMPGNQLDYNQINQLRQQVRIMFWLFLGHTLLVYYSVFFMSKEAWAFISGGLFYIIAAVWFLIEVIRQKIKQGNVEWVPVLDNNGKVIGKATREQVHSGNKILHPVVHLHVFNSKGELYIQKRPAFKKIQPNKWDTAVGGHVDFKETPQKAIVREAKEELSLQITEPDFLFSYIWESEIEREFVYVFAIKTDIEPAPNPKEVDDGKFLNLHEIKINLGKSFFTPNFEEEFKLLTKRISFK
jgi:isopentenyldiphosphate isomerase/intracellular septation protein A